MKCAAVSVEPLRPTSVWPTNAVKPAPISGPISRPLSVRKMRISATLSCTPESVSFCQMEAATSRDKFREWVVLPYGTSLSNELGFRAAQPSPNWPPYTWQHCNHRADLPRFKRCYEARCPACCGRVVPVPGRLFCGKQGQNRAGLW